MRKNLWWGYKHENGSYQVKRFYNHDDIHEATESPFTEDIIQPFPAKDREEALEKAKELNEKQNIL